ncbi:MAG: lysophospholipid acyltransferase family protein [Alphaproteobacteria bacterium]|nr:lysophospholipid acyltransferase family protein [Alphaproteobacteria bacterium]
MSFKFFIKSNLKKVTQSGIAIRLIALLIYVYTKLVGRTCTWQLENMNSLKYLKEKGAIFVVWHSRAAMMPFFYHTLTTQKLAALTSPHPDGQIIAHMLKHYQICPVNGSSNENAQKSALELMHILKKNWNICISPDGPRGPRMRMKKSPIYYAQKTGAPIICACFSVKKATAIKSTWDKMMIPLPFCRGIFCLSDPLYIPEDLTDKDFEAYRQKLEDIANNQVFHCDEFVGRPKTLPAALDDYKKKETL